jgi:hypothetical protein
MKKLAVTLSIPFLFAACAQYQASHNPDAGDPMKDNMTNRPVNDVIQCMTQAAAKHDTPVKTTPIPQGQMLDFGESNIVKIRADNGATTFRYYAGKRNTSNLWIESASKECAP